MNNINFKSGLSPIINKNSQILILGSLPSDKSIEKLEYYGNPTNNFWTILSYIFFNTKYNFVNYNEKINFIYNNKLALWDVYSSANRLGSLDSNIKNAEFNDIKLLLKNYPNIKKIITNGKKSEDAFLKYIKQFNIAIPHISVPSSSAANTLYSLENKINIWTNAIKR